MSEPHASDTTGERIEQLLVSFAANGPLAQQRAQELVRLVSQLHGEGIERILQHAHAEEVLTEPLCDRMADDELVSGLLLLHGLHPYSLQTRVERALERVRPYLASHGGDVSLQGISDEGVVALQLQGNCQGCPSSSVTLRLAVEGAVEAAAPEITGIECEDPSSGERVDTSSVISVDSLLGRLRDSGGGPDAAGGETAGSDGAIWEPLLVPELGQGEVRSLPVGEVNVVICRVGQTRYAYRDGCASCSGSLAGASLQRSLGAATGTAILTCPNCGAHFDVSKAGVGVDNAKQHLVPLPLLEQDGELEIAVPA